MFTYEFEVTFRDADVAVTVAHTVETDRLRLMPLIQEEAFVAVCNRLSGKGLADVVLWPDQEIKCVGVRGGFADD